MIVTSIHHVYGAWIYNTPWRRHVLFVSVPVIIITVLLNRRLSKKEYSRSSFLFWLYWLITFIAFIGIGLFEGIYNHLLKDILFYAGVDHAILLQMFPPPAYEMPNEFFFEFTGVLQAFIFIPLAFYFFRLTKKHFGNLIARRSV
jgi:hypothetical protein